MNQVTTVGRSSRAQREPGGKRSEVRRVSGSAPCVAEETSSNPKSRGTTREGKRNGKRGGISLSGALLSPIRAEDLEHMLSSADQSSESLARVPLGADASLSSLAIKAPTVCSLLRAGIFREV